MRKIVAEILSLLFFCGLSTQLGCGKEGKGAG